MDAIAGLLDGPRARRAFLLRCTMDPPWALHIRDEAPLSLVAMLRGRACFAFDGREPQWLDRGDVAILLGPDHYLFADDPATPPQAIIHPDQRCTTPDGQEIPQMRSFGVRRWGNAPDGATEILTGTYNAEGEVSRRLLDALPPQLVLHRDEWQTPVLGLLAAEMPRDEVGQDAVLDRLLDLLLIDAVRTYFARTEQTAPGWYRAQRDPVVGAGRAVAAGKPRRGVDHRRAGQPDPGVPGHPGPALRRGRRPAADGVPHPVAADPRRRPHPGPAGDRRLGRPHGRLRLPVRAERRLQAGPRRQPARAPRRPAAGRRHRRRPFVTIIYGPYLGEPRETRADEPVPGGTEGQGESETGRLEAFSDGVLAVIITIMALELKAPVGQGYFGDLRDRLPALLIYILSFTFVGIYWNNHHHLLRAARRVTAGVMWANLHLLFWLSLIPVLTEWIGEHYEKTAPAATYGVVGFGSAVAFTILIRAIIRADGSSSLVATAIGSDTKGRVSLLAYAAATALAFVSPWISYALFAAVAVMWFIPDRRLSRPAA